MPRIYSVRITKTAASELDAIFQWVVRESPQNAHRVLEGLLDSIFSLKLFPTRYKLHQRANKASEAVHAMPVPPFVVYYRVREQPGVVQVLSVRHGARRKPRRFD